MFKIDSPAHANTARTLLAAAASALNDSLDQAGKAEHLVRTAEVHALLAINEAIIALWTDCQCG
jgi:hypothetical protein